MNFLRQKLVLTWTLFFLYTFYALAQDSTLQEQQKADSLQFYIQNAQYQQAIEYIDRSEPTKDLLYQKALCLRYLNDYSNAIEVLDTLSEKYPDDIPIKLQLAICYEAVAQFPKSIDCYNQVLQIDSTNTYFEVRIADLLFRSEKYALALDTYSRVDSTYNPNYIAKSMAMCYEKLNQLDSAKNYYSKAWELDARDVYSANSLVKIYMKKEDYVSAYQYSEQFIEKDSTNVTMNAMNAYSYYNLKYYDIAIKRFEKCLQQGDSSLIVNRSLGFSYFLLGKDSIARPFLQQAFLQDTTNNNVLFTLGKVNYELGYYPEAVECFSKMVEKMVPSDILVYTIYKELAMALEKNQNFPDAINSYETALNYTSDNADKMDVYYSIATIMEKKLKNYGMAALYYSQYRTTLLNYQNSLKDDEQDKINEIETKLTALDKYIESLREEAKKQE